MGVQVLEQDLKFTYLNENIEKHAKPNNTCNVYDLPSYINNTHPILNEIKTKYIDKEINRILTNIQSCNLLEKDYDRFYVTDHSKQGFPRIMINIKDEQLYKLSKKKHIMEYKKRNQFFKDNDLLKLVFHNINDIQVCDIQDKQPEKVAFKKILGDPADMKEHVMMYGKNKQTLFAALKRQIKTAPIPDQVVLEDFMQHSTKIIDQELGESLKNFSYDVAQWYNHLSAAKQGRIRPIYNYYNHPELLLDYTSEEIENILSFHYTAIVKSELQELDGKPRMVCSIPQHIKYIMGPVTWMLEEIATKNLRGYCGGLNLTEMSAQLNEYIKQGFTKVVEGDGSAFDNTQDVTLKAIDRYIYNKIIPKIYHVPKDLFEQVANSYYKIMDVNYRDPRVQRKVYTYVRYFVLGTVFSGDCDTTLMNTIRMVLYNRYVNDKAGLIYGKDYIVYAKGDDFSVLYKNYVSDEFIDKLYYKYFLPKSDGPDEITDKRQFGLGQILKFLDKGDASTFKFCSLRSWYKSPVSEEITLTRDPAKLYNKSLYAIKYKAYNNKQKYTYHIQQAVSYQANYKGIDVFELLAEAHFRKANEIKNAYHIRLNKQERKLLTNLKTQLIKHKKEKLEEIEFTNNNLLNKILRKLYDICSREKYIDFYTTYWEQVKMTEQVRTEINTKEELKYINDQINQEFDTEELKSLLALK